MTSRHEDYVYSLDSSGIRPEYKYIVDWIEKGSKVLDLGCGNGSLGSLLIKQKNCEVHGIETSKSGVESALNKGVHATIGDIDEGLDFSDSSFDYVVINVTLQMVYRPGFVLSEALRVGKKVIVSFPNFAHWAARLELLLLGRMPRKPLYGYRWHNTKHIHLFSYKDFCGYLEELGVKITKKVFFGWDSEHESSLAGIFPNIFSMEAILMVEK
ncbi:Ubiquinone/menaquinone biosynthesis C-methyltransferase UbiE [uncultured archaeon]|nr:Ubiquinone/menaquinone biosynthesis C-methyltransferase UbiE [uncultured archaeon]